MPLAALLACSSGALAEDSPTKVWLNPGVYSHHLKEADHREDNYGIGAEVFVAPQHGVVAGSFINSNRSAAATAAITGVRGTGSRPA